MAVRLKTADHNRTAQTTAGRCRKLQDSYPNTAGRSYKVQTGPFNDRRMPQDTFPVPLKGTFRGSESNRIVFQKALYTVDTMLCFCTHNLSVGPGTQQQHTSPDAVFAINFLGGITLLQNSVPKAVEVSSGLRRP